MGTDAYKKIGPEYAADPACEDHDIPFGNDETLETRTLAVLPVGLQESVEYCVCMWYLEERHSCCQKELLRDPGCHIDLGRGHLFCGDK